MFLITPVSSFSTIGAMKPPGELPEQSAQALSYYPINLTSSIVSPLLGSRNSGCFLDSSPSCQSNLDMTNCEASISSTSSRSGREVQSKVCPVDVIAAVHRAIDITFLLGGYQLGNRYSPQTPVCDGSLQLGPGLPIELTADRFQRGNGMRAAEPGLSADCCAVLPQQDPSCRHFSLATLQDITASEEIAFDTSSVFRSSNPSAYSSTYPLVPLNMTYADSVIKSLSDAIRSVVSQVKRPRLEIPSTRRQHLASQQRSSLASQTMVAVSRCPGPPPSSPLPPLPWSGHVSSIPRYSEHSTMYDDSSMGNYTTDHTGTSGVTLPILRGSD